MVFCVLCGCFRKWTDSLDLMQAFVATLGKCFENVIFHRDNIHNILAEMVMEGMVLETNMNEIATQIDAWNKLEKSEVALGGAPARAESTNVTENPRYTNIGDTYIIVTNLLFLNKKRPLPGKIWKGTSSMFTMELFTKNKRGESYILLKYNIPQFFLCFVIIAI